MTIRATKEIGTQKALILTIVMSVNYSSEESGYQDSSCEGDDGGDFSPSESDECSMDGIVTGPQIVVTGDDVVAEDVEVVVGTADVVNGFACVAISKVGVDVENGTAVVGAEAGGGVDGVEARNGELVGPAEQKERGDGGVVVDALEREDEIDEDEEDEEKAETESSVEMGVLLGSSPTVCVLRLNCDWLRCGNTNCL